MCNLVTVLLHMKETDQQRFCLITVINHYSPAKSIALSIIGTYKREEKHIIILHWQKLKKLMTICGKLINSHLFVYYL